MIAALLFPTSTPILWSVDIGTFTLAIRWYALAYIAGFLLACGGPTAPFAPHALAKRHRPPHDKTHRRFPHLGNYRRYPRWPPRLRAVLLQGAWLDDPSMIYKVWEGGMSFHGGILGVVVATILFARRYTIPLFSLADILALGVPIGLGLGRLANFINAELWGKPTTAPWGVVFPNTPDCPLTWLDPVCARHPSQLYEAILEGIFLFIVIAYLAYRRGWLKTPGALTGIFFIGYGTARFIVEFFRQGDAQFTGPTNPGGTYCAWAKRRTASASPWASFYRYP